MIRNRENDLPYLTACKTECVATKSRYRFGLLCDRNEGFAILSHQPLGLGSKGLGAKKPRKWGDEVLNATY